MYSSCTSLPHSPENESKGPGLRPFLFKDEIQLEHLGCTSWKQFAGAFSGWSLPQGYQNADMEREFEIYLANTVSGTRSGTNIRPVVDTSWSGLPNVPLGHNSLRET